MIQITPHRKILVALAPVDFRKGIDGLAAVCPQALQSDPLSGTLFVFISRRRQAIQCRVYDTQGFWICQKRLSLGRFHGWPQGQEAALRWAPLQLHSLLWKGESGPSPLRPRVEGVDAGKIVSLRASVPQKPPYPPGSDSRYLIAPWVRIPHLASHLLGRIARRISADWQSLYHHPLHLLESFVDSERFQGTSYRAANWKCAGRSVGRGTKSKTHEKNTSIKELWVYPLHEEFRRKLTQ